MRMLLLILIAWCASGCCSTRRVSNDIHATTNAERVSEETLQRLIERTQSSAEEQARRVFAELVEDIRATITRERYDSTGRVIERTTADVEINTEAKVNAEETTCTTDTIAEVTRERYEVRDSTRTQATIEAQVEELQESRPSVAMIFVFLAVVAAAVYVLKRIFLF